MCRVVLLNDSLNVLARLVSSRPIEQYFERFQNGRPIVSISLQLTREQKRQNYGIEPNRTTQK